jgi:hypothetical protein
VRAAPAGGRRAGPSCRCGFIACRPGGETWHFRYVGSSRATMRMAAPSSRWESIRARHWSFLRLLGAVIAVAVIAVLAITQEPASSAPIGLDILASVGGTGVAPLLNLPRFRGHCRSHESAVGVIHGQAQAAF